ncbi:MAG: helix-turn-helix domain-containing protein, partial [Bacillota bacterium]
MDKANGTGVNALFRAFRIVEALNELGGAGVSAIAREVDLPKSTVHNHLTT